MLRLQGGGSSSQRASSTPSEHSSSSSHGDDAGEEEQDGQQTPQPAALAAGGVAAHSANALLLLHQLESTAGLRESLSRSSVDSAAGGNETAGSAPGSRRHVHAVRTSRARQVETPVATPAGLGSVFAGSSSSSGGSVFAGSGGSGGPQAAAAAPAQLRRQHQQQPGRGGSSRQIRELFAAGMSDFGRLAEGWRDHLQQGAGDRSKLRKQAACPEQQPAADAADVAALDRADLLQHLEGVSEPAAVQWLDLLRLAQLHVPEITLLLDGRWVVNVDGYPWPACRRFLWQPAYTNPTHE